jgi:hypothetical protein
MNSFSSATPDPFKTNCIRISVGILITPGMKKNLNLWRTIIQKQVVGVTCETCAVKLFMERLPPIHLEQKMRNENTAFDCAAIHDKLDTIHLLISGHFVYQYLTLVF